MTFHTAIDPRPDHCEPARWYLAQLKPNAVQIALRNLRRQAFEVFNPTQMTTTRRAGKFFERESQLFPGYLFVRLDPRGSAWRTVNSTYGVARLVRFGSYPAPVPQALITDLAWRCDENGRLRPPEILRPGDCVRLTSGPFADFVTRVEAIAPDQRVWVLLDILGRATRVAVAQGELRRA